MNFPSKMIIEKKIEKKNVTVALNVLYAKKEKIYPAYVSKDISNRENQVILLMISDEEKFKARSKGQKHYLAVKKLSALFRGISSKHHGDFYCLNCIHSFATEKYLIRIKNYVKIKIF